MAMIVCPNCGQQISDKAAKCVYCGMELVSEEKKICTECGAELERGAEVCLQCGCPVESADVIKTSEMSPGMENAGIKSGNKTKKIILAVILLLAVVAAAAVGIVQYQKKKAEEEAARISQEYIKNLDSIAYLMLSGASDAEDCGNLIKLVWYNSIFEEYDISTDPYTRPDGVFVSDFNIALGNLFADSDFSSQIEAIEENQRSVKSLMKELKNPPEEYQDAYEALTEYYDAYLTITNLIISPSGSLQTFAEDFSDADTEILNCYKAMEMYIED